MYFFILIIIYYYHRFHPPDPFYKLQYNTETKNFDLVLDSSLPRVEFNDVKAEIITTETKTKVG